jgi:hypothetical protein
MWEQMDEQSMFGTERQSTWSKESMEIALFDFGIQLNSPNQKKK